MQVFQFECSGQNTTSNVYDEFKIKLLSGQTLKWIFGPLFRFYGSENKYGCDCKTLMLWTETQAKHDPDFETFSTQTGFITI